MSTKNSNTTMFREQNCKKPARLSEADPLIEEDLLNWFRDGDFSMNNMYKQAKFTRETYDIIKHEFFQ
jgi:hypothetical protein